MEREIKRKRKKTQRLFSAGVFMMAAFIIWTILILLVDVRPVGQNGTNVGFAALNMWFYKLTGVHMTVYTITDWLGLIPLLICVTFGGIGLGQMIRRKSLFEVDFDLLILGIYYLLVLAGYMIFERIPINYRPILIEGVMEASYPSSTTLLVLSVMSAFCFQIKRRIKSAVVKKAVTTFAVLFSVVMVIGRSVAGVHWLTDIIGSVLLSTGLFLLYKSIVLLHDNK